MKSRRIAALLTALVLFGGMSCGGDRDDGGSDAQTVDTGSDIDFSVDLSPFTSCDDNTDCAGGEVCRDESCREACSAADSCEGDLTACADDQGICVECTEDDQCGDDERCDLTVNECAAEECDGDSDCDGGFHCVSHACEPIDTIVCAANEQTCDDDVAVVCSGDGTRADRTDCSPGVCVQRNNEVSCSDTACQPNSLGCLDDTTAFSCDASGDELTEVPCRDGRFCDGGQCRATQCVADSVFCEDDAVVTCDSRGAVATRVLCNETDDCAESDFGCSCLDAACEERVCDPGSAECTEEGRRVCADDGLSVLDPVACDDELVCVAGACLPETCTPEQRSCQGNWLLECDEDGESRILTDCTEDASLCLEDDDSADCVSCPVAQARVRIQGTDGWSTSLTTLPLDVLEFDGSQSRADDRPVAAYEWEVVQRPDGSTAVFQPNSTVVNPSFFLDLAGVYRFRLTVVDADDVESCESAEIVVRVNTDWDVLVELVWDTPGDDNQADSGPGAGSDMDLHFMHPNGEWDQGPWDCHWKNKVPNWGNAGSRDDDPHMDIDDTDGAGPEQIGMNGLEHFIYKIGVFYFSDHGYGASDATVRVFIDGELIFERTFPGLTDRQFWDVGRLDWSAREVILTDVHFPGGFP